MTDLEELYFDAIRPRNLIKHIPDLREWLSLATCKKDLECTLRAFEADELYEECCVIRDYLKKILRIKNQLLYLRYEDIKN